MTAETTLRIAADFPNVIGIKEASGNIGQIQEIIDRRREGFLVLSGDDGIAVDVMRRGGDGVISVAVNAFPRRFMGVHRPGQEGRFRCGRNGLRPDARSRRSPLRRGKPHRREMRAEHPGLIGNRLRLPLVAGTPALEARLRELIRTYDLR